MFLKEKETGHLVEVLGLADLFDPYKSGIVGRYNVGEEMPDPMTFEKSALQFPSGEPLPRCWIDPHYRDEEIRR